MNDEEMRMKRILMDISNITSKHNLTLGEIIVIFADYMACLAVASGHLKDFTESFFETYLDNVDKIAKNSKE